LTPDPKEPAVFHDPLLGFQIGKPDHWEFLSGETVSSMRAKARLAGGEEARRTFREESANFIVAITPCKYPHLHTGVTVAIEPVLTSDLHAGSMHSICRNHQARMDLMRDICPRYEVIQDASATILADLPASRLLAEFQDVGAPTVSRVESYLVRHALHWFTLNLVAGVSWDDEADHFKVVLDSLQFFPPEGRLTRPYERAEPPREAHI
jgi:hypothetical protein